MPVEKLRVLSQRFLQEFKFLGSAVPILVTSLLTVNIKFQRWFHLWGAKPQASQSVSVTIQIPMVLPSYFYSKPSE